ncbi:putative ribonuclease H-like domain-containing protein, partial [Tanacetum coccineum]
EIGRFSDAKNDDSGADINNLDTYFQVSPIPTIRIQKDYPLNQVIGDLQLATQTRQMTKNLEEYGFVSTTLKQRTSHKDLQNCLFSCSFSQDEPKKVVQALKDPSWIGAMQDELLQLKLQKMDVKSDFLCRKIKEEVYVCQPPRFEDPDFHDRVYKVKKGSIWFASSSQSLVYVDDIIFGSIKKKLCTKFENMTHKKFQMSSIDELTFFLGLQVRQKEYGIFISQDNYVTEILNKFSFSDVKIANTPMETDKPLLKNADGEDVDEHMYRSMIGSLMYLTSSRLDIMFVV